MWAFALLASVFSSLTFGATVPYPPSAIITSITFDMATLKTLAPGSDNWVITWADNDHQYTSWGDGGGFGGDNTDGRVSMGVGRIEGTKDAYQGYNVWGGKNPENPAQFSGKSYGILSIGADLYMWRCGNGSDGTAFAIQDLYKSTNHGATWTYTGVKFEPADFSGNSGFYAITFCQFGKAYAGARDNYVYMYAPENKTDVWDVQAPGEIALMRVHKDSMNLKAAYRFFTGFNGNTPAWSTDPDQRTPVFSDPANGVMRTSVSYNPGIGRYLLITQQVSRLKSADGHIGIYDAPEPWGPWTTVLFDNAWDVGTNRKLQNESKTVYWNFSNKWLSQDGKDFVLVYTGDGEDNWGTVQGSFTVSTTRIRKPSQTPAFLFDVFPNPFNPAIKITLNNYEFQITRFARKARRAKYELKIFNIRGELIKDLTQDIRNSIIWDASAQPSGVYLVVVRDRERIETKQIFLSK